MKSRSFLLFLMLFAFSLSSAAQDIITKTDDSAILAKVVEVSSTMVKYRKYNNLNGPIYSEPVDNIKAITYENGAVERFTTAPAAQPSQSGYYGNQNVQTSGGVNPYPAYGDMSQTAANDMMLLQMTRDWEKQLKKAKRLRLVGWLGSIVFYGIGVGIQVDNGPTRSHLRNYLTGAAIGAGVVWCVSFNLAANYQKRKSDRIMNFLVYESPEIKVGEGRLSTSVDVLSHNNTHGMGIGVRYTF